MCFSLRCGIREKPRKSSLLRSCEPLHAGFVCQRTSCYLLSSRRALSREARPPWVGEVTLSQELRTARSPRPHVLVGYQWSHTGLRPGRKTSHNRYIRSFVSHPPQIRACTSRAPGSSSHEFATRAIRRRYVDMVQVTMYLPGFSSTAHETVPPCLDGVPRVGSPASTVL